MTVSSIIRSLTVRWVFSALMLSLALSCTNWTAGAEPAATLDKALARAMDRNPGIIAARAKVALAQAELNSTRMEAARQVIALWGDLSVRETAVETARKQVQLFDAQYKKGAAPASELDAAKRALIDAEAKLSRTRSDLRYMAGDVDFARGVVAAGALTPGAASQGPRGDMKQLLSILCSQMSKPVEFVDVPVDDVIALVSDTAKLAVVRDRQATFRGEAVVTLQLKAASVAGALQAIEDQIRGAQFVVRDYGILLTDRDHVIQEGLLPVSEFIRDRTSSHDQPAATSKTSPPATVLPSVPKK